MGVQLFPLESATAAELYTNGEAYESSLIGEEPPNPLGWGGCQLSMTK
ncbi:MAG: hypothetical protein QW514_09490 [Thermoprotei archaeon]